jgi:hypothetical protein
VFWATVIVVLATLIYIYLSLTYCYYGLLLALCVLEILGRIMESVVVCDYIHSPAAFASDKHVQSC